MTIKPYNLYSNGELKGPYLAHDHPFIRNLPFLMFHKYTKGYVVVVVSDI